MYLVVIVMDMCHLSACTVFTLKTLSPLHHSCMAPAGESRELAAMEEDFLKTLAETRGLEQAFSAAMANTDGDADSGPGTRLGFQSLVSRTDALKSSVADILKSLATERQRFGKLHNGWRVTSYPISMSSRESHCPGGSLC